MTDNSHGCSQADLVEKYLARNLPDPNYSDTDLALNNNLKDFFFQSTAHPTDDAMRRNKASYYGMIELIDRHYGRIIDALDAMGLWENTIVIFNSDHGEMLGDHGLTHKGCRFYEGITHVPLIISLPGTFRQNAVYGGLVEQTDLAPTIADLGGIPPWALPRSRPHRAERAGTAQIRAR